jgi:acyl-coenzyme A thioesterase PaaI-like protein
MTTLMEVLKAAKAEGRKPDLVALIAAVPYARYLGITVDRKGTEITTVLTFGDHLIGNPILRALHGGVVGGFLETTAMLQVVFDLAPVSLPKPVDVNIDYLRSGRPVDTYARAFLTKQGRRVVNVHAEAWQEEHDRPIATLRGHFLVPGES